MPILIGQKLTLRNWGDRGIVLDRIVTPDIQFLSYNHQKRMLIQFALCEGIPLDGLDMGDAHLSNFNFNSSSLVGTHFDWCNCRGADFTGCNLTGASFRDADIAGAIFIDAILDDVDWKHTRGVAIYE